tara:strand:+ start:2434 stop:2634 length:201 start_codon:yes stop_codon:yes gene_type:complete
MIAMLYLSQIVKTHNELERFDDLVGVVAALGRQGVILLTMDEKPPYADTPENWELALESAFTEHER